MRRQSRRTLLRLAAGATLGAVTTPRTWLPHSAQSVPEKTLRVAGSIYGIGTFDPALSRDLDTNFAMRQLHRGLMQFTESLEPEPAVAESVEILDDGQRYRFTVRDDMRFSSGGRINAHTVATSLSRSLNPATAGGDVALLSGPTYLGDIAGANDVLAGRLQRVSGIEVESEGSLTITLNEPSGTFLMRLCSVPASIVDGGEILTVEGTVVGPAGVGPFMVSAVDPDHAVHLVPSPAWTGETSGLAAIELRVGTGAVNPFNLFQAGDLDLIPSLQHQLMPLAADPASGLDAEVITTPLFALAYIAFGTITPPLDDVHVRRALAMVLPGARIASDHFQGRAEAPRGLIPQGMLGHNWKDALLAYDPDRAREELAQSQYAGGGNTPPIEIFAADIDVLEPFREQVVNELALDLRLYDVPWTEFLGGLTRQVFPAYSLYWGADYPDPESMLWMLFGEGSADNYVGHANADFEQQMDTAQREVDDALRADLYAEAERLLLNDGVCLPLYQDIGHTLVRHGVQGVPVTPMGVLGLESVRMGDA